MIVIDFTLNTGLANQLWVYCSARSIADKLGIPFSVRNYSHFVGKDFLDIDTGIPERLIPSDLQVFTEHAFYDQQFNCLNTYFDPLVMEISRPSVLNGSFQSEDYFFGEGSQLVRRYMRIKPIYVTNFVQAKSHQCVVYIRGGEYKRHKSIILPISYWEKAMSYLHSEYGVNDFLAVSDDDRYVKHLLPSLVINSGSMIDDFVALSQAKYAIIANSSWAYFPLALNESYPVVIAPVQWARYGNQYMRWSMPCNYYPQWNWMNPSGVIWTDGECRQNIKSTLNFYQQNNKISCSQQALSYNKTIRNIVPRVFRVRLKKLLSLFFPSLIG